MTVEQGTDKKERRMVDSLLYQLTCMDRRIWQNLLRVRRDGRYTVGQRLVLLYLLEEGSTSQCELASAFQLSGSSITENLKKLERDGCIQRSIDPHDNRVKKLTLTPAGRTAALESREEMNRLEESMMEDFSPEEQSHLLDLLIRMDRALQQANSEE